MNTLRTQYGIHHNTNGPSRVHQKTNRREIGNERGGLYVVEGQGVVGITCSKFGERNLKNEAAMKFGTRWV